MCVISKKAIFVRPKASMQTSKSNFAGGRENVCMFAQLVMMALLHLFKAKDVMVMQTVLNYSTSL